MSYYSYYKSTLVVWIFWVNCHAICGNSKAVLNVICNNKFGDIICLNLVYTLHFSALILDLLRKVSALSLKDVMTLWQWKFSVPDIGEEKNNDQIWWVLVMWAKNFWLWDGAGRPTYNNSLLLCIVLRTKKRKTLFDSARFTWSLLKHKRLAPGPTLFFLRDFDKHVVKLHKIPLYLNFRTTSSGYRSWTTQAHKQEAVFVHKWQRRIDHISSVSETLTFV